ncbi:hypothetical protein BGI37_04995 [Snodgrassella alvi]|nr:hypothetical protein BGI37_04995 [Snodgrassella alvi]
MGDDAVKFGKSEDLRVRLMISKIEIDTAADVLAAYERTMADRKRQGHCLSAEWRYGKEKVIREYAFDGVHYKPEVFALVKSALSLLAQNNREAFNVLGIEYGRKSPYFKRRSITARHRAMVNRSAWAEQVERALVLFWAYMQHCENFDKYFFNSPLYMT